MGYTTYFEGEFKLDRPLTVAHKAYLDQFNQTRRMERDADKTALRGDPRRLAVGLPVGEEGAYFVGESGMMGQNTGHDVLDHNGPPKGQPGLWCKWVPNQDGTAIEWSEAEKFYDYTEWIAYLIEHFLEPWGYKVNGKVTWDGEDSDDKGTIHVKDNMVQAIRAEIVHPEPDWD